MDPGCNRIFTPKPMKNFLQRSHTLWVITRGILLLVFAVDLLTTNFAEDQRHPLDFAGDLRNIVFFIIHLIMLVYEIQSKRKPFLTRSFAAGLSFLLSLGLFITAVIPSIFSSESESQAAAIYLALIPVAAWVFLFGLFDAMDIQTFNEEEEHKNNF
jgi:glucan phosphoethanolaminetransferase (alkaline phosphatase superfamily)